MKLPFQAVQGIDLDPSSLSYHDILVLIGDFLASNPHEGKKLWDLLAVVRGPDCGLGLGPDYEDGRDEKATKGRNDRKALTGAIIRAYMFPKGVGGASAKFNHHEDTIFLPPKKDWDHYDKHVWKAINVLDIPHKIEGEPTFSDKTLPTAVDATFIVKKVKGDYQLPEPGWVLQGIAGKGPFQGYPQIKVLGGSGTWEVVVADIPISLIRVNHVFIVNDWNPSENKVYVKCLPRALSNNFYSWVNILPTTMEHMDKIRVQMGLKGTWVKGDYYGLYTYKPLPDQTSKGKFKVAPLNTATSAPISEKKLEFLESLKQGKLDSIKLEDKIDHN